MAAKKSGDVVETVKTIVSAVAIALVVRTFAYEPFNIPSGSMMPTLLEGDYLFVSKFSYGYSGFLLPFLDEPLFEGRVLGSGPERGDVVVFKLPSDPSTDYIKRVIGLPGDRIQVRAGILHINDQPVELERVEDYRAAETGAAVERTRILETLPSSDPDDPAGRSHYILERTNHEWLDNTEVFTVPAGHYFMMGDNRDNSVDSRASVGFVPEENLVGRAEFLWFSLDGGARFWEIWRWPFEIRLERMFTGID